MKLGASWERSSVGQGGSARQRQSIAAAAEAQAGEMRRVVHGACFLVGKLVEVTLGEDGSMEAVYFM